MNWLRVYAPWVLPPRAASPSSALSLAHELGRDLRHMATLEAGHAELVLRRLPASVGAGEGRSPIGRAAGNLAHRQEVLAAVGQADDDHALMQQRVVEGGDGRLLPAMLG